MRLETLSYHVEPDKDNDKDDGLRKWDRAVRTTKQSGKLLYLMFAKNCKLFIILVRYDIDYAAVSILFAIRFLRFCAVCIRYAYI